MLEIRLIGQPRLLRDGLTLPGPRGAKCWALLARIVRSQDPISRQQLVNELFSEADDPMAALRWSLAELRRRLGMPEALRGNPITADLAPGTVIDVAQVVSGALPDPVPRGALLEGIEVQASPSFDTWLLVERQRVAGEVIGALRKEVLRAMSAHDHARAVMLASAMVDTAPLEEGPHVLLVKAFVAAGDRISAHRHVAATEAAFLRELGVEPGPALSAAARPPVTPSTAGVSSAATAESLLTAGRAAVGAGAAGSGIATLRGAVAAAEGSGDGRLDATCLFELGSALVHAACGYDDEGAIVLDAAREAATTAGEQEIAAKALAELAYVDVLAARRECAVEGLALAWDVAAPYPRVRAAVAAYDAVHLSDWGRLDASLERFDEAIDLCRETGSVKRGIWAMAHAARAAYLSGWLAAAERWAKEAQRQAQSERWTAIRPWPEAWHAHVRLAKGESPAAVRTDIESSYALARQLEDPCWEGVTAKVMGLTYVAEGDVDAAMPWLEHAGTACRRINDSYKWLEAEVQVTDAEIALAHGDRDRARSRAEVALQIAARGDMPLLLQRAEVVLDQLRGAVPQLV
ncbi:BTAD domain-containing putative transcriptional regulator [Demequina mangrovi]|uniref:DNA-binding transcriptional activator of the SARP family n=1 Tax=Demequina mangrovi TaxID=1043493 RepID=A0A1H7B854_9MICO|nr:BTAD domain-containing putative transcriptional regulator [Demequina mangrovi]SEJ70652.1 DNA-binding transcriptional activator of the SARP family [Demequina mangrovi]